MDSSENNPSRDPEAAPPPLTWNTLDVVFALVAIMAGVVAIRALGIGISGSSGFYNAAVMTALYLFFLAVVLLLTVIKYGRTLGDLGFKPFRPLRVLWLATLWWLAVRLVILVYSIVATSVAGLFGAKPPSDIVSTVPRIFGPGLTGFALAVAVAVIVGPVIEEIFFRGFLYPAFRRVFGVWPAIIISSAIFGIFHANVWLMVPISLMGGVMAYLYEKEGSLAAPIAFHALNNLVSVVIVYTLLGK